MLQVIKKNTWFYIPYFVFLLVAGAILLVFEKKDIHLFLNSFHCAIADFFFKNATHLGDGITVGIFIFILLFVKYRHTIIMLICILSTTLIVQSFKRLIMPDIVRPKSFFDGLAELYFVPGVDVHSSHSFPSGHTSAGFTLFMFIALICKKDYQKFTCFLIALAIGYSRVYLSQHFLNDIYFGSIIAVFLTSVIYVWVNNWKNNKLDLSLINTLKK